MYVDESGHAKTRPGSGDGHYILCGMIVHEKDWRTLEDGIMDMKRGIFPEMDPRDSCTHPTYGKRGIVGRMRLQLSREKKAETFSKILEFVYASQVTLLCVVVCKDQLGGEYPASKITRHSWTFLAERFEHFLIHRTKGRLACCSSTLQKNADSEIRGIILDLVKGQR